MNFMREFFSASVIVHILDPSCNISSWVSTDFEEKQSCYRPGVAQRFPGS